MTRGVKGVARAAGAAKKAVAVMQGRIGILATLSKEHGEVSSLLAHAHRTRDDDKGHAERRKLREEIRCELLSHMMAEEKTLYSRLQAIPDIRERAIHGSEEHAEIEALVEELSMLDAASGEWHEVCGELIDKVHHHVHDEEHELFVLADGAFATTELEQLDEEFKREKDIQRDKIHDAAE